MREVQFYIKGMHCNSCTMLITETFAAKPGIIKAEIDYRLKQGLVVFNEMKLTISDIHNMVKSLGDYEIINF